MPWHKEIDKLLEEAKGENKIGSTLKGIGPTYTSKVSRDGFRIGSVSNLNEEIIEKTLQNLASDYDYDYQTPEFLNFVKALTTLTKYQISHTELYLNKAIKQGKRILAEGAQGALLDIDFGTYPFVTSSNTCIGGVMTGLGIPPQSINRVIGITKAYCTRVGSGPFLTEQENETGEKIRKIGNEFGSTTGRPRRCGWLDLVALEYACMLNGVTELALMKIDVLSEMDTIKVCVAYDNGVPIYRDFEGWNEDISRLKYFEELPENCKIFVNFVESTIEIKVNIISVGADRIETIYNNEIFTI